MKVSCFFLLFGIFFCLNTNVVAQQLDWLALSDASHYTDIRPTQVDKEGNFFVMGRYRGEILFKSAQETGKQMHSYISENLSKGFLLKYDPNGTLLFTVRMSAFNSSSNLDITGSTLLPDGRLVMTVYATTRITITDATNTTHYAQSKRFTLVYFSNDGTYLDATPIRLHQVNQLTADANSRLYFTMQHYRETGLFYLDTDSTTVRQLTIPKEQAIYDMTISGTTVWLLTLEKKGRRGYPNDIIRLLSWDGIAEHAVTTHFQLPITMTHEYIFKLLSANNEIEVMLGIHKQENKSFALSNGKVVDFNTNGLIILNTKGERNVALDLGEQRADQVYFQSSKYGGYYGLILPFDSVSIGETTLLAKKHSDYSAERILLKFDQELSLKWQHYFGATSKWILPYKLQEYQHNLLFVSPIQRDIALLGQYTKLNWRMGVVVLQMSLPKEE